MIYLYIINNKYKTMPPKKTTTEPKVSETSTTKNRKNLLGQQVKVTKTNTRTDYGNKVVDKKTKNKVVSVSPKRTVLKEPTKTGTTYWSTVGNKAAKKLMTADPKLKEGKGSDRNLNTTYTEKTTTYGGTKKNIFGKEKPGTTVKKTGSKKYGTLGKLRGNYGEQVGKGLAAMYGAAILATRKKP